MRAVPGGPSGTRVSPQHSLTQEGLGEGVGVEQGETGRQSPLPAQGRGCGGIRRVGVPGSVGPTALASLQRRPAGTSGAQAGLSDLQEGAPTSSQLRR